MIMLQTAFFLQVTLALEFAFFSPTGLKTACHLLYLISSFSKLIRIFPAFISTFLQSLWEPSRCVTKQTTLTPSNTTNVYFNCTLYLQTKILCFCY